MRRREFITLLGGAAATWPLVAHAQQGDKVQRIGVLNSLAGTDPEGQAQNAALRQRLHELGWVDGRNVHIDERWGAGNVDSMKLFAQELVRLGPDVLVSATTPATAALQQETHTIPIVFVNVADPIGAGFAKSIARPGGNITGFGNVEASLGSKWVELLHDVVPRLARVAMLFNPQTAPYAKLFLDTSHSAAAALSIEPIEAPVRSAREAEAIVTKLGGEAGSGLIVLPDTSMFIYRQAIILLAERYRLPTIYPYRFFVADGGLMSYGIDLTDSYRGAATYADRILHGAKPNELAIQLPTRFEMVINLKTAQTLGLEIPHHLLVMADGVIE
jgi:putative tryptophan/tyrosine transport system substrate-binding protein